MRVGNIASVSAASAASACKMCYDLILSLIAYTSPCRANEEEVLHFLVRVGKTHLSFLMLRQCCCLIISIPRRI